MSMDSNRLKTLAGIRETDDLDDETPEERAEREADDARYTREKQVKEHIEHTFKELGFDVNRVWYDEKTEEVEVDVENYGPLEIATLAKVLHLGYGTDYKLLAYASKYEIAFKWNAVLAQ